MEAPQRSAAPFAPGRFARDPAPVARAPARVLGARGERPPPPLSGVEAFLSRAKPRCVVHVFPHSEHVTQIYAGLYALHASGRAVGRQSFDPAALRRRLAGSGVDGRLFNEKLHGLLVEVDGTRLVFFD